MRRSLRFEQELMDAIGEACTRRAGKISINTWIAEAIKEKLDRESRQQRGKQDA